MDLRDVQPSDSDFRQLIVDAHAGNDRAVATLLEMYRVYLGGIARRRIRSRLNRRLGVSDLVQQTLIEAHQNFHRFAGDDENELLAWLRQILHYNIANAIRDHLYAQKRALTLEQPLESGVQSLPAEAVAAATNTPSLQVSQIEESLLLLQRLEALPADQAAAVRMRYLECRSISEVAADLKRTKTAAAGLVKRGIQKLRQLMTDG